MPSGFRALGLSMAKRQWPHILAVELRFPVLSMVDQPPQDASFQGVPMSDCLHCDIHEMLEGRLQSEQSDLADIAAKVTKVLADLILMAPPAEQLMLMADVVANLGGIVRQKNEENADPTNPRPSRH
jgi:hypothetical protein